MQEFDLAKQPFLRRFAGELGQHSSKSQLLRASQEKFKTSNFKMMSSNIKREDTGMGHKPAAVPLVKASLHDIKY